MYLNWTFKFYKYFKCPNTHELKWLLLEIFQTVPTSKLMIFETALAFYFKAKTFAENRKRKQKRERES